MQGFQEIDNRGIQQYPNINYGNKKNQSSKNNYLYHYALTDILSIKNKNHLRSFCLLC